MKLAPTTAVIVFAGVLFVALAGLTISPGRTVVCPLAAQTLPDNTPPAAIGDLTKTPSAVQYPRGFFIAAQFVLDQQKKDELNQKFDVIVAPGWADVSGISPEKTLLVTALGPAYSNSLGDQNDWNEINQHEDWFLHSSPTPSPETRIVASGYPSAFYMNIGSEGWRNFVASKFQNVIERHPDADGVFVDGPADIDEYEHLLGSAYPAYSASEYETKALDCLSAIESAVGQNKLVILNANLEKSFTARTDGNTSEGFVHFAGWENARQDSKAQWLLQIKAVSDPNSDEKYILVGSGSLESTLPSLLEYCYASFLIAYNTRAHCYFYWHSNAEGGYATINWFPLWEVEIGEPTGVYFESNGVYRRNFTQGVVLVNPNDTGEPITVTLDGLHTDSAGAIVTSLTLPNKTGAVLKKLTWQ